MKKKIFFLQCLVTILVVALSASIPFAQEIRSNRKQLFDYDWKFSLGDESKASDVNFDDNGWRKLDLPHDWSIEGKMEAQNPMGNDGGYFPAGVGWYRKTFTVPASGKGKPVSIYFEGVYMNAQVFINGRSLGIHPYGYTSFSYDLTPYLKYGDKNILSVRVDNSQQKNSRWYSGSGIYRHVWLIATEYIHLDHWGVFITTPEVSVQKAVVQVNAILNNNSDSAKRIVLSTSILEKTSRKAGIGELKIDLQPHSQQEVVQHIPVNNPLLWNTETPNLYTAQIEIRENKKLLDKVNQPFGIRSIKFSTDQGFELNGKTVKLNGGCVHHDNGSLGAAAFDRAEERKAELLKAAGFNAVRTSHNPPSEAFLDACDKLGLLVIDEAFDGWRTEKNKYDYASYFDDWAQRDIDAMVKRDRNHPAVIMWSTGNEIIERKKTEAIETARKLSSYVKKNDTTRPVTSAMTTWDKDWAIFDPLMAAHDIAGYNYQLHRAESDHARVPSRIIVQTESYPRDAFANWNLVQKHSYIIGDFVWTAMDYLGESGIGRYYYPWEPEGQHWERNFFPWHGAYCGDIDLSGWRKPISHYRNLLYNDKEKLYMAVREPNPDSGVIKETMWAVWPTWESWTWPGKEGKTVDVEVYSKYPAVRLYLNGKLVDEKSTTEQQQFKATFAVSYAPGELRAVGVTGDKEGESTVLRTAGDAFQIKLKADRSTILANGQDLAFVTVEITDKDGNIRPDANNELIFTATGPGTIAAVDNANLKDITPYTSQTRNAWNGRALAIIRSTQISGKIQVKVSSSGLTDALLTISAKGQ